MLAKILSMFTSARDTIHDDATDAITALRAEGAEFVATIYEARDAVRAQKLALRAAFGLDDNVIDAPAPAELPPHVNGTAKRRRTVTK